MNFSAIHKILTNTAICAILCLGHSCVNDNSSCPEDSPGFHEGNEVWLSFDISGMDGTDSKRSSRADIIDPDGHPDEESTAAENYIDVNDVSVFLLDNNKRLLKVFNAGEYAITETDADHKNYTLTLNVNREYFNYAGTSSVTFSIMIVANKSGISNNNDASFTNDMFAMSVSQMANQYKWFGSVADGWTPDIALQMHIPMAGISTPATLTKEALDAAKTPETASNAGEILMQRALAKIRVIDAFNTDPANKNGERIQSVSLVSLTEKGAYIPVSDTWPNGTCVLENATMQSDWFSTVKSLTLTNTATNTFTGYVTECEVTNLRSPKLIITVIDNDGKTQKFEYALSSLKNPGVKAISRNHIYEFEVTKVWEQNINLNYTVCQWGTASTDIDFN